MIDAPFKEMVLAGDVIIIIDKASERCPNWGDPLHDLEVMRPDVCSWLSSIIYNRRDLHDCRPSLYNDQKAKYKREKKSCICLTA